MTPEQLRHAQSIARHVLTHVERLPRDMKAIESLSARDVTNYPVAQMEKRIEQDVQHGLREIGQVLTDMLPELKNQ